MDWMLDRVVRMSPEEIVWYLTMGMIGNGLFVAPILTYVIPAYYGNGWSCGNQESLYVRNLNPSTFQVVMQHLQSFPWIQNSPGLFRNVHPSLFHFIYWWQVQKPLPQSTFWFYLLWSFIISRDPSFMLFWFALQSLFRSQLPLWLFYSVLGMDFNRAYHWLK